MYCRADKIINTIFYKKHVELLKESRAGEITKTKFEKKQKIRSQNDATGIYIIKA